MANNAAVCAERATSDMLIGPDWAINIELSDILNTDPRQAKDAVKILRKRLGSKTPKIQLLALLGVKQEVVVDLVEQCHSYQKLVMILLNNTLDEELLLKGLALNDSLHRVLQQHHEIAKGTPISPAVTAGTTETPVAPLMNVNHEDDESEDDFAQLAHRSPRDTSPVNEKYEPTRISPFLPPPPPSRTPTTLGTSTADYLSGDAYDSGRSSGTPGTTPTTVPSNSNNNKSVSQLSPSLSSSSPPNDFINPTVSMFTSKATYDEPSPMTKSADGLPPAPRDVPSPGTLPSPPSGYNQRQQFLEPQQHTFPGSASSPASGLGSSYDGLVGKTQNLSLNSSTSAKEEKPEDAFIKDLVDFAKSKSSSPEPPVHFNLSWC